MAPLFTNLALWIGAFSLVLLLKLDVDEEGIDPVSSATKYVGRWMLLAFFGVIQALVVSIGDLIIGVQTVSRPTFVGDVDPYFDGLRVYRLHARDVLPAHR